MKVPADLPLSAVLDYSPRIRAEVLRNLTVPRKPRCSGNSEETSFAAIDTPLATSIEASEAGSYNLCLVAQESMPKISNFFTRTTSEYNKNKEHVW